MSNRAFDEVQAMIDDRYGLDSPESIAVKEAFRVYLAWLDAPMTLVTRHPDGDGVPVSAPVEMIGKRVRLVEVK